MTIAMRTRELRIRCAPPAVVRWHCPAESANFRRRWYHEGRMPTYDYLCENGHRFELVQRFTDDALDKCV